MTTRSEDYLEGYLVGEELIRVVLEHHHIALIFQEYGIQIFGVVNFVTNENEQFSINARNKDTNLALFWKSIGKSVVEFRRKDGLYMKLSNSSVIGAIA